MKKQYFQGFFKPKNYEKYKGNPTNIKYKSSWELKYLMQLDKDPDVLSYSYETIIVPYLSPIDGKKHRYYVDFYIPSQNKTIECKSTWTMKKGIEKNNIFLKQQAVKDAGYECEIWVYNSKGEKVECYN